MNQDKVHPDGEVEEYIEPVFTADNRHLPKMFDVLEDQITDEEAEQLLSFIDSRLLAPAEGESEFSSKLKLLNRPDNWDDHGVIEKIYNIARSHIMGTYWMVGNLEPRDFIIMRTEDVQKYEETYGAFDENGETLYTAVVTPCPTDSYFQGETRYTTNGEGFVPSPTNIVLHRNERLNDWEITEVVNGTRYDLLLVFQEPTQRVSYDFEIEQTVDDGVEY